MKLTYLDMPGRAEPTRLALMLGGVDYEDSRFGFDQFATVKAKQPFQTVPSLEVDGEVLSESNAMLRFAGKKAGLYPTCEMEAFRVDMVVDAVEPPMNKGFGASFEDDKPAARAAILATEVPRCFGGAEKFYAKTNGPFLLGEKMTIADLKVMTVYRMLTEESMFKIGDVEAFKAYPHIQAASKAVLSDPKVAAWVKANPIH